MTAARAEDKGENSRELAEEVGFRVKARSRYHGTLRDHREAVDRIPKCQPEAGGWIPRHKPEARKATLSS